MSAIKKSIFKTDNIDLILGGTMGSRKSSLRRLELNELRGNP